MFQYIAPVGVCYSPLLGSLTIPPQIPNIIPIMITTKSSKNLSRPIEQTNYKQLNYVKANKPTNIEQLRYMISHKQKQIEKENVTEKPVSRTILLDADEKIRVLGIHKKSPTKRQKQRQILVKALRHAEGVEDAKREQIRKECRKTKPSSLIKSLEATALDYQMGGFFPGLMDNIDPALLAQLERFNTSLEKPIKHELSADQATNDIFNRVGKTLSEINEKLPNFSDEEGLKTAAKAATKGFAGGIVDAAAAGLLMYLAYAMFMYREKRNKQHCTALILTLLFVLLRSDVTVIIGCKDRICNLLKTLFEELESKKPDSGRESPLDFQMETGTLDVITELIGISIFGRIVGSAPDGTQLKSFWREMGSFERSVSGVKNATKLVMSLIEKIVNWVRVNILKLNSIKMVESEVEEVRIFVLECMTIADRQHTGDFRLNQPNGDHVHRLWVKGNALLNKYASRDNIELRLQVQNVMKVINALKAKFEQANILTLGTRQVPLCVIVRGPSGVGKSAATVPLVSAALSLLLPRDDLDDFRKNYESFIYSRQPEHVFWDGYRGQFVCAFDDFGQLRDVPGGGENEYSEFIRAGNIFGFILHMADIESKGGIAFKSNIIMCTTNIRDLKPTSIVEPEAVNRRFDIDVLQVPPPEYCLPETLTSGDKWNRRLDVTKVNKGFDPKACEYHELNHDLNDGTGGYTGNVFTFDEMVQLMVAKYSRHADNNVHYKRTLMQTVEEYIGKRADGCTGLDSDVKIHKQIDLDHILATNGMEPDSSNNEYGNAYVFVRDESIKNLFCSLECHKRSSKDELMESLSDLMDACSLRHMDRFDVLEQILRASPNMFSKIMVWNSFEKNTPESIEGAEVFYQCLAQRLKMVTKSPQACALFKQDLHCTVSEGIRVTISSIWENFKEFFHNYSLNVKQVLANHPILGWFYKTIPMTEPILMVLVPLFEYFCILAAIKAVMGILHRMLTFLIPGFYVAFDENVEEAVADKRLDIMRDRVCNDKYNGLDKDRWPNGRDMDWDKFYDEGEAIWDKMSKDEKLALLNYQSMTKERNPRNVGKNNKKYVRQVRTKVNGPLVKQFGSNDPVCDQILSKIVASNCYELWVGPVRKAGFVTFVRGNIALMPWHFVTEVAMMLDEEPERRDDSVILKKCNSSITMSVPIMCLLDAQQATGFETLDACLVQFPREVHTHKDIVRYFQKEKTANKRRDKYFVLYSPKQGGVEQFHGENYSMVENQIVGEHSDAPMTVRLGYRYRATTDVGDCGTIMACVDPSSGREKIMGIHTGGNKVDTHGFTTAVCQEDLLETLELFDEFTALNDKTPVNISPEADFDLHAGRFVSLGYCEQATRMPETTNIVKSKLHGKWGSAKTAPARLRPFIKDGQEVDPFKMAIDNYCTKHVLINTELMAIIGEHISDDLDRVSTKRVDKRLLTMIEAIKGIEDEPDYRAIPRDTSPGFPYNLEQNSAFPGKTAFFGFEQEYDLSGQTCQELMESCNKILDDAKRGIRGFHIFTDCLKDERRPLDKVIAGKTRLFSGSPLCLTIIGRMYFGAWNLWMIKNKIHNGSAIGVNQYSYDWQMLADKLQSKSKCCVAGDYSKFDGSEQPEIHWAILDVINRWYDDGPENARVRHILWEDLVNSKHIRGKLVYSWVSSLPSGHFLTTLINIMYGFFALRYCWFRAHENDLDCLLKFLEHVYVCELGDDLIMNFSDEVKHVFNQQTLSVYMSEIGLTYTDENKQTDKADKWKPLTECTFLKRGFRIEESLNRYVGPLALESVLESPYWTQRGSQKDTITKTTTETCLMELSLHEPSTFKEWAPKLIDAYNAEFYEPLVSTRRSVLLRKACNIESQW